MTSLEEHIPGWSKKLLAIRRDIRKYELEKTDIALTLKELRLSEARLLKLVEGVASAIESTEPEEIADAVHAYHQG
jgi:hypothetical protein